MTLILNHPTELELAESFPLKSFEKYDDFLTDELKSIKFANNHLDLSGALDLIKKLENILIENEQQ